MIYLIILALLVLLCMVFRIASKYLYILAGMMIFLHPLLLAKGQAPVAFQLSIIAFLVFLSALIVDAIAKVFSYRLDEHGSSIINAITRNVKFKISGVQVGRHHIRGRNLSIVLVLLCILLFWGFGFSVTIFFALFFIFVVNKWSSRIIAACALVSLSACPFLLVYKQEPIAERFAVYAYYLLTLTVVLLVIEQVRDRTQHEKNS